jgi:N6-adenosine-specific RNA methylase IME4
MSFGLIVADNPWSFDDKLTMSDVKRGSESQYPVLDLEALWLLPIHELAADNAVLVSWCPAAILPDGLATFDAWGFEYKQLWTWVKTSVKEPYKSEYDPELDRYLWEEDFEIPEELKMGFGMGRLARNACEYMLVGVRGRVYEDLEVRNVRNVFLAAAMKHSAKPEKVQDALEMMFPTYRGLELFARRNREDWICCGDECPTTMGEDIRKSLADLG